MGATRKPKKKVYIPVLDDPDYRSVPMGRVLTPTPPWTWDLGVEDPQGGSAYCEICRHTRVETLMRYGRFGGVSQPLAHFCKICVPEGTPGFVDYDALTETPFTFEYGGD
jgi:hypothetical protein